VAGLLAGSVLLVLMVFAGGAAGPGRMADVGVPGAVTAAGTLALAVTLGAAVAAVGLARLNLRRGR
jgi:hypothetical protein